MSKKQLGQFFTTNSDYVLAGLEKFIAGKEVTDPFVGGGDLTIWARKNKAKSIRGFDIDPKLVDNTSSFYNDSLSNPQDYKFVLTNPPYLNINKATKETKEKYFKNHSFEDLYQISLASIMNSDEGIVIVPINFLSAENSEKIRKTFFSKFKIVQMNYFKHQVFEDTTYNVIAFYYKKTDKLLNSFNIETYIFPEKKLINIELSRKFDWAIGGEYLNNVKEQKNLLGVYRLTEEQIENGPKKIAVAHNHIKSTLFVNVSNNFRNMVESNLILLRAIDSGTKEGKIRLENIKKYNVECLISKPSSRNMVYLVFNNPITLREQLELIELFNKEVNNLRENYLSLFLTNFRDNDRKRISFDFVYKLLNYLYFKQVKPTLRPQPGLEYNLGSI